MRKWFLFGALIVGILFPFEWLANVSSLAAWFLRWAFDTNIAHMVMHTALFIGLGLAVMELLAARPRWQAVLLTWTVVASAALGQEAFQAISAGVLRAGGTLFDLGVDVVSGGIGIILARALLVRRSRAAWVACLAQLPLERQ